MDPERWRRVEEVYHSVLLRPEESRKDVLAVMCADDSELRREVASLLSAREQAGDFLSGAMRSHLVALGDPAVGDTLGPYQIVAEAAAGAMGQVYRALDTRLDRQVALKVLPVPFATDAERVARFRREAKAISALNHPNIVTIHDIGQTGGTLFIATEWIEGVTLRERMADGKLPLESVLDIATQCSAGLEAAHHAGIVHRDIKPENIMIRPDGLVKLVDFGLARVSGPDASSPLATQSGSVIGTPRYMSPEQAKGQTLDPRTDIFSLGAVLYEMTYGRPAFPGATTAEVLAALLSPESIFTEVSGRGLDAIIAKALRKDAAQRYARIDELGHDLKQIGARGQAVVSEQPRIKRNFAWRAAAMVVAALLAAGGLYSMRHRQPVLSDSDTILLTDFVNQTGDPLFDLTLKQGLSVQLNQSPRLQVFPETGVRSTLRLMERSPDDPVTAEIGREICQRQGLKALVTGLIASLGSHYAITLTAIGSLSGNTLAQAQAEAAGKEQVLHALSKAASELREKLGEPVHSLRKFDAMLEVTTPSLEALKAYSLGRRERLKGNTREAVALLRHAIELDPNFAAAYTSLTIAYANSRQPGLAAEAGTKAYQLRDHASERERLAIMSEYFGQVTGDAEKRIEITKLQMETFPFDTDAQSNLAVAYNSIGRFEEALEQSRAAVQSSPTSSSRWAVLGNTLIRLGRFSEAAEAYGQALRRGLDSASFHQGLYRIGFVNGDQATMAQQVAWAAGKRVEYNAFDWQGAAAAALGQRRQADQFAQRIGESVSGRDVNEAAAGLIAQAALRDAALGECTAVKKTISQALAIEHNVLSLARSGLAQAWCGDPNEANMLGAELARQYPQNSAVNGIWLPAMRAATSLKRGDAQSAVDALQPAARYEAAGEFWPQYLRGLAWLRLQKADEAAAEFRKILDHRGQDPISPLYPLARLGLARDAMLKHDDAQAQKMYGEFLAEWKNADSDLPAVAEAKNALARIAGNASPVHASTVR